MIFVAHSVKFGWRAIVERQQSTGVSSLTFPRVLLYLSKDALSVGGTGKVGKNAPKATKVTHRHQEAGSCILLCDFCERLL